MLANAAIAWERQIVRNKVTSCRSLPVADFRNHASSRAQTSWIGLWTSPKIAHFDALSTPT
jgi:hypothetical protein